ncbi:glycosyltransferase [Bythopirellula polymerisocia]|uniref:Alpha-monoglucosyldiacylglycerol synthase n=1 Tax=Bythopirellula polymerisocia TaxID=2528003 RepID=A0A5C6CSS2_9BACT|nr:glycosyltransferase [Bythopirellula polymerisocia]TWU25799.1 Alpha-monoglucosyldiacylglycerol synthase [Bythopirellula polymerisocia]
MSLLVVLWNNFGPYHVARLIACEKRLKLKNIRVIGIELAGQESTRDWQLERESLSCEIHTLAPDVMLPKDGKDLSPRMIEKLDELSPDYIAAAGYDRHEMRSAIQWAKQHHRSTILMSETKWDDRPRPFWKTVLIKRFLKKFDSALVSGAAAGEYLVTLGFPREHIFRQYGVIDNEYVIKATDRLRSDPGEDGSRLPRKYFLACSRLIESRKNIRGLLSGFARFQELAADRDYQLVICGDGPDREMLESFARDQGICDVSFVGFQQLDNLVRYYAHAFCFVHTAVNEAWGLVVNEAMAAGLPILVSSRCGCAYDLVSNGANGFTFNPYDTEELAQRMLQISQLPETELKLMGESSREIISRFGPDQFAQGIQQAIECASRR